MDFNRITREMIDSMTKDELVALFDEFRNQRAFTYTDQMKLAILDESPFTIWASDRDCKITLWEGQCETLYGYSHDYAIGKDYVSLFVAPDEQAAARRDQISIIDDAAVFHNIANDVAKTGNTLQLITNCFRIWDSRTEQYWNAEMGLIVDYFEQEKERLELIITESRKVKSFTTLFVENTRQRKAQYQERKKSIRAAIADSKRKAAMVKRLPAFNEKVTPINTALDELQCKLYQIVDDYYQTIQACADASSCETLMLEFDEVYEDTVYAFEDIVVDFEEINTEYSWDNTLMQLRDEFLKANFESARRLEVEAYELLKKAEDKIADFRRQNPKAESTWLKKLTERRDLLQATRDSIINNSNEFTEKAQRATDDDTLTKLRKIMDSTYKSIFDKLSGIRRDMEKGA